MFWDIASWVSRVDKKQWLAIQVARDVGTKMLCSHNVPKKGLSVSHGVAQLLEDTDMLEHWRMSLKTDGEVALFAIQAGLRKNRSDKTLLQNSPVRDS